MLWIHILHTIRAILDIEAKEKVRKVGRRPLLRAQQQLQHQHGAVCAACSVGLGVARAASQAGGEPPAGSCALGIVGLWHEGALLEEAVLHALREAVGEHLVQRRFPCRASSSISQFIDVKS